MAEYEGHAYTFGNIHSDMSIALENEQMPTSHGRIAQNSLKGTCARGLPRRQEVDDKVNRQKIAAAA